MIYINIPVHDMTDSTASRFGIILYYCLLLLIAAALVGYGQQIARTDTHHEGPGIPHSKRTPMSYRMPERNSNTAWANSTTTLEPCKRGWIA